MTLRKEAIFNSKILLFGEYSLMKGSMALSIPFKKYNGKLLFDNKSQKTKSNHYSVKYLIDYHKFLANSGFEDKLNLIDFKHDIECGLIFDTNIPISYGLGSSGAIVASIYNSYAYGPTNDINKLKDIFSKMESYYHGKSSGLDPLVSFLNKPILIDNNHEIKTVDIPKQNSLLKGGIFLVDTKTTGETQPLVNWFLNEYESIDYQYKIQNQLIPLNNNSITNMLSGDFNSLLSNVKLISKFTLENFKPMIPNSVRNIWETGLGTNDYYLKLCGSGGGGMMLGFTNNIEDTTSKLRKLNTQMILLK